MNQTNLSYKLSSTYTMKSSMSIDLALFSLKSASWRTLSIFLVMLKSAGTSCWDTNEGLFFFTSNSAKLRFCSFIWTLTHHVVNRTVDPVVLFQQLLHCGGPGSDELTLTSEQDPVGVAVFLQQAGTHLKAALRVLFFLTKAILTRPSHSYSEGNKKSDI